MNQVMERKIAVYGAGAMGTVLGAFLTAGGLPVTLVTRNKAHVTGLNTHGATIVCEADGVFKVQFSQNNQVVFDGENNRIGFVENGKTEYISLPSGRNFAFDSGNTVVELKILKNQVQVGFYAQGESADRLYEVVASYTYTELFTWSKWQLIAGGKLTVDEFRSYNLDTDYPAEKTDYSPEHDKVSAWIEKEADEKDEGCGSTLSLTSGLTLLCVATAFACKKRKEER